MKILLVSTFYFPNEVGGAEVQTRLTAELLHKNGFEVDILAFDGDNNIEISILNGIKIIKVSLPSIKYVIQKIKAREKVNFLKIISNKTSFRVKKELYSRLDALKDDLKKEYDIVQFCGNFLQFSLTNLIRHLQKIITIKKKIIIFHDHILLGRKSSYPNKKIPIISSLYKMSIPRNFDLIITPSIYLRKRVEEDFKLKNKVIDIPNLNFINKKNNYSDDISELNITYAGSIEYMKGLDILVDAFKELLLRNNKVHLHVIGSGDYYNEMLQSLSSISSQKYTLYGKLTHDNLLKFFQKTDIVVLPSRFNETFGLTLIEGYFSGALPIGMNRGAIPELLNNDKELLFNNSQDLLNILIKFTSNFKYVKIKYNSLSLNLNKYSTKELQSLYINFYKQLLNTPK